MQEREHIFERVNGKSESESEIKYEMTFVAECVHLYKKEKTKYANTHTISRLK